MLLESGIQKAAEILCGTAVASTVKMTLPCVACGKFDRVNTIPVFHHQFADLEFLRRCDARNPRRPPRFVFHRRVLRCSWPNDRRDCLRRGAMLVFTGLSLAFRRFRAWNARKIRAQETVPAGPLLEE
jgi:hypothetical protein